MSVNEGGRDTESVRAHIFTWCVKTYPVYTGKNEFIAAVYQNGIEIHRVTPHPYESVVRRQALKWLVAYETKTVMQENDELTALIEQDSQEKSVIHKHEFDTPNEELSNE